LNIKKKKLEKLEQVIMLNTSVSFAVSFSPNFDWEKNGPNLSNFEGKKFQITKFL
jgi:hypothetical protein